MKEEGQIGFKNPPKPLYIKTMRKVERQTTGGYVLQPLTAKRCICILHSYQPNKETNTLIEKWIKAMNK